MNIQRCIYGSLLCSLFIIIITGCSKSTPEASEPTPYMLPTLVAATFKAMTPQVSPTLILSQTIIPSKTTVPTIATTIVPATVSAIVPSATSVRSAVRFDFLTGSTFGVLQGNLQAGQSMVYVLNAIQGQPMIVIIDSPDHDMSLEIRGKNDSVLLSGSQAQDTWQGLLPVTQDYYIKVIAGAAPEDYTLSITVASRIMFSTGSTSGTVTGTTVNGYNVTYVLRAMAGQTMNLGLTVPLGTAALTVYGFSDGQPYLRSQLGQTNFSMILPTTQDYIIEIVPQNGLAISYSMMVTVH